MSGKSRSRIGAAISALVILSLIPLVASAQVRFNVPTEPLAQALDDLARQADLNVYYDRAAVAGLTARALQSYLTPKAAFARLLAGTRLVAVYVDENTVRVVSKREARKLENEKETTSRPTADGGTAHPDSKGQRNDPAANSQSLVAQGTSATMLPQITVTAQKRSQNIQDVPIAMSAMSAEQLEAVGIQSTSTLPLMDPSLNYTDNNGFANPFIRGIGSDINQQEAEPSVATYVDGVYVSSQSSVIMNLLGVKRVEVLNGPQGTLYGRNATGGAINVYTLTPGRELDAQVTESYGNFNNAQISAHLSGPVSKSLDVGLYVGAAHQDTYHSFYPNPPPGQPTADYDWGVRAKAVWRPTDALKFTASIERTGTRNGDASVSTNVQANSMGYYLNGTSQPPRYTVESNTPQFLASDITFAVLREEADLGFAKLVGISGYRDTYAPILTDVDGTYINLLAAGAVAVSRQYSQEIQLLAPTDSAVKWVVGLYYFHEKGDFAPYYVDSNVLFPAPIVSESSTGPGQTISYAAYAQATFPLAFVTRGLRLTLGGRITRDEKVKLPATSVFKDAAGAIVVPSPIFPTARKYWTKFTPKVTIAYRTSPAMFYVTYAQGYKSGEFNLQVPAETTTVQPEQLTDIEEGVKSNLFGGRLRLNLDEYNYDFKNLQLQRPVTEGVQVVTEIQNAAVARAHGVELSAAALVTQGLTTNLNIAWEHSRYTRFPNAPYYLFSPTGNTEITGVSATGHPLIQAPTLTVAWSANYKIPLNDGAQINFDGNVYHNSGFSWSATGQAKQPAYTLLGASVGVTSPNHRWKSRVWVRNLTNTYYFAFQQISGFGITGQEASPRTFGVSVTWRY